MRGLFLILFTCFALVATAQKIDSLKQAEIKPHTEEPKTENKNESFGDYVQKVGLSIWGRVKERLNLESVVENIEDKKDKILGDKEKKELGDKEEKQTKGKDVDRKEPSNKGDT